MWAGCAPTSSFPSVYALETWPGQTMADTAVDVIVQIAGEDVLAGRLWSHRRPGSESTTFSYASDFLERPDAYELDPLLPLFEGQQQTPEGKAIFGAFADGAPDRWGRRLIHRTELQRARRDEDTESPTPALGSRR